MFENIKDMYAVAEQLNLPSINLSVVGSTLICGKGNDLDILCLMPPKCDEQLRLLGWNEDLDDQQAHYDGHFASWRKDNTNLLVTSDHAYFMAEVTAAWSAHIIAVSGQLDMSRRDVRVAFHSLLRQKVAHHLDATNGT